ncbi:MAG: PorP/SprF family type IX secretion system membrane protein [Tannerella sp.]|nr:PorP/SprF family type IX secretion system membrane protein [Tannerella sp.]
MKRCWIIIMLCSICVISALSQSDSQFNHYFRIMGYYNPAYAGKTGDLNANALYRMQWLGMDGNTPRSIVVVGDMPFKIKKTNHGVGLSVLSEKIGLDEDLYISGQYAYKKKIGKGTLSIGLQLGLMSKSFRADSLKLGESNDHAQEDIEQVKMDAKGLDLALGLFYSTDKYYIGLASSRILEPTLKLSENIERKVSRGYNLTAGYNIQTRNPLIQLQPSVFVQMSSWMVAGDITARVVYNNMFNGGLGTRISDNGKFNALILYLGASIKKFHVGYAYEYPTSAISNVSSGSHEFMVTYRINLNKKDGNKNKHKSIRIL